jgi:hypothetical protein
VKINHLKTDKIKEILAKLSSREENPSWQLGKKGNPFIKGCEMGSRYAKHLLEELKRRTHNVITESIRT